MTRPPSETGFLARIHRLQPTETGKNPVSLFGLTLPPSETGFLARIHRLQPVKTAKNPVSQSFDATIAITTPRPVLIADHLNSDATGFEITTD
ncbi:DUF1720 domain-containing protein [Tychonema sp. LEGE 07203]|uniref:DUF1720 domain-containing protein n=1 Tax=Tychonema sp. LEGE 07203 TaxID=1828671 RepID=UPI00351CAA5C